MLCDRLVCGVEEPRVQQRLLAEPDPTFDKAFEPAVASEFADKNAKDLQPTTSLVYSYLHGTQEELSPLRRQAQCSRL